MSEKRIFLDYAASTPMRAEVKACWQELSEAFANPSSSHREGRKGKSILENSRRRIAKLIGAQASEIYFTSGGTEADNSAIFMALRHLGVKRIISSPIEHHAVLNAAQEWAAVFQAELCLLPLDENGDHDLGKLEEWLQEDPKSLVSLMHGNNEIGNLLPLEKVGALCQQYGAYFHSDTVQTIGHFPFALSEQNLDMAAASAHKFHGPKGIGFLYLRSGLKVGALMQGGSQERGLRGGTENAAGAAAMALALELAYRDLEAERRHIEHLKALLQRELLKALPQTRFNGRSADPDHSLYTVLSARLPDLEQDSMLLFALDLAGLAVSGGSACSSGAQQGSHVISHLYPANRAPVLRFSLGKDSTEEDIHAAVAILSERLKTLPR